MYHSVKENDGTYSIRKGNEIYLTGVRGCNVRKAIDRLCWQDLRRNGLNSAY